MDEKLLKEVRNDFSWVERDDNILAVLMHGSVITGDDHAKSDVDISVVVPGASLFYYDCEGVSDEKADARVILGKVFRKVNVALKGYDVYIFEELPLYIQAGMIDSHEIIHTSDKCGLYEYFFNYRKLWDDQKHRNTMTKEELLAGL